MRVRKSDHRPPRPGLPLLLPGALALWAAAAASYASLAEAPCELSFPLASVAAVAAAAFLLAAVLLPPKRALLAVCFALLGVAAGCAGSCRYHALAEGLPGGRQPWVFTLTSDPAKSDFGMDAEARAVSAQGGSYRVRVYFDGETDLLTGERFASECALRPVRDAAQEWSYSAGIVATASVADPKTLDAGAALGFVHDLRRRAIDSIEAYGGEGSGVLAALVCGYRNPLKESGEYERFKQCGLAHIVAVSGAHLAIVTLVFGWVLRMVRCPRWGVLAASTVFVAAYLLFSGIPVSAVRAAVMVVLALASGLACRRNASLNALALCLVGFVALDPASSVSVSLFLSAGSTLGIVVLSPLFSSWFCGLPPLLEKALAEPLSMTLAANTATLPFSVALFKQLPLIAPVSNVAACPLFTLGCVGGLVATLFSCAAPDAAPALIGAAAFAVLPLRAVTAALSAIPYGCVAVDVPALPMLALSAAALGGLWAFWPKPKGRLAALGGGVGAALALALALVALSPRPDQILMLDVDQGDAILVRSGTSAVLVDTGNRDRRLREELGSAGVFRLDAVAVTHPDEDHCASLQSLFGYVEVERFLCAADLLSCPCAKCASVVGTARRGVGESALCGLEAGDVVTVGNISLKVVWPHDFADEGGNADSLCLMASIDCEGDGEADWRVLLTGDAESDQLAAMAEAGDLGDVDVLKVGHHGSKASLSDEAASLLDPELALVSVGAQNRYGHPADEALARLEAVGAEVLRTDERGTVCLSFAKEGIRVQ